MNLVTFTTAMFAILLISLNVRSDISNDKLFECRKLDGTGSAVGPVVDLKLGNNWAQFGEFLDLSNAGPVGVESNRNYVLLGSTYIVMSVESKMLKGNDGSVRVIRQNGYTGVVISKDRYSCSGSGTEG